MLLSNKCEAVTSVAVELKFDDGSHKRVVIAEGDLIAADYNKNGLRRHIDGKVCKISCIGTDVDNWYLIVDGSEGFDSQQVKFCPHNILDCDIIYKADAVKKIETPKDNTGIMALRIVKGQLQFTQNGYEWYPVRYATKDYMIREEEGTIPDHGHMPPPPPLDDKPHHNPKPIIEEDDDDEIKDEEY